METFGVPWPEFNDGLVYTDHVKKTSSRENADASPTTTLIDFYCTKHRNSAPVQGWIQRIQNGQISVDDQVVTNPHTIIRTGSKLVYHRLPWKEPDAPYLLQVLFEDDHLLALNKPSGLQVLPGGLFQQRTVLAQLQWRLTNCSSSVLARSELHPVPVHRLGRGTSGILLCAKSKTAKICLASYFADGTSSVAGKRIISCGLSATRKISKVYRALVKGIIEEPEVVITESIGLIQYPGVAHGLYVASSSGKPAFSKVKVLERNIQENQSLVQVEIQSGRPHQIRIHLSFIGHPLVGDPLYVCGGHPNCFDSESRDDDCALDGGYQRPTKPVPGDCGYFLHAHRLTLHHPSTSEVVEITAPLPSILETPVEQ